MELDPEAVHMAHQTTLVGIPRNSIVQSMFHQDNHHKHGINSVCLLALLMSCKLQLSLCDHPLFGVHPSVRKLWWHKCKR